MAGNGLAAFKAKLAKVPKAIRDEVNAANRANAQEWVKGAKAAVPIGDDGTADLYKSIRYYESDTGGWIVRAGGKITTREVEGGAGGTYDYARAQEFGRRDMPANPYFWTTYRLNKKRFNARRKRALAKAVKAFNG